MSSEPNHSSHERVGARPLTALTTETVGIPEESAESQPDHHHGGGAPIGISPLSPTRATAVMTDDDDDEEESTVTESEEPSSIVLSQQHDVFGLLCHSNSATLQSLHPQHYRVNTSTSAAAAGNTDKEGEHSSDDEEYHSPCEEVTESTRKKRVLKASPYDYNNVSWDVVGHSASSSEEPSTPSNTTSLANAAAASMIAATTTTTVVNKKSPAPQEVPALPPQQPFFLRPSSSFSSSSRSYRYQRHVIDEHDEKEEEEEDLTDEQQQQQYLETASEFNESSAASTTSSGSASHPTPSSTRRRRRRRRPRHARTSSLTTSPTRTTSTLGIVQEASSSSLDSGMAAVRRWIRNRTTTSSSGGGGSSSRAARRWQRGGEEEEEEESPFLQLGEEDWFALTHAGTDPRRRRRREEEFLGGGVVRQRALSEPNNWQMRNYFFQRAAQGPSGNTSNSRIGGGRVRDSLQQQQQQQQYSDDESASGGSILSSSVSVPHHLSSAALNSSLFHHSPSRQTSVDGSSIHEQQVMSEQAHGGTTIHDGDVSSLAETSTVPPTQVTMTFSQHEEEEEEDPNREARTRWIRINRRFQLIITVVALIFSLLLFSILICWVVFTSAYVLSIEKQCDVPIKQYFWLATLQLILDVFRTDIMRFVFRWDTHSNSRIPVRVILYNIAYLIYAVLVLRLGVKSVFMSDDSTCPNTAPELYQSSAVFVSLSIAAWSTIVLGYLVPFCFVATMLTWNGYTPTAENQEQHLGGVFPAAYSTTGAPPGCVDRLRTVLLEEFPDDYPRECCICMGDFVTGQVIVATECQHVFHKRCCEEWLRQARTCPVCRMDIPSSLSEDTDDHHVVPEPPPPTSRLTRPFPGREDFHQDVVGLLQILRRQEHRVRQRNNASDGADRRGVEESGVMVTSDGSAGEGAVGETEMVVLEEGGRASSNSVTNRQHSR